jgi:translation initiation factor IF-2
MKVFELAKELDFKALDLIDKVKGLNLKIKNHMSDLSDEEVVKIREFLSTEKKSEESTKKTRRSKSDSVVKRRPVVITRTKEMPPEAGEAISSDMTAEAQSVESSSLSEVGASEEVSSEAVSASGSEAETTSAAPAATQASPIVEAPAAPAAPATPPPQPRVVETRIEQKKENSAPQRYSVIRIASRTALDERLNRPLIVKEAPEGEEKVPGTRTPGAKTEGGQWTAESIIREIQREESQKKKSSLHGKDESTEGNFKSTDYLRRERVYQAKKKKIAVGKGSQRVSTIEMGAKKRFVAFDTNISVTELAEQLRVKLIDVLRKLNSLGVEKPDEIEDTSQWLLDFDTAQIVAGEFDFAVKDVTLYEDHIIQGHQDEVEEVEGEPRGPVVTIMGHVDHGKTSILDMFRRSRVVAGEAGGITQHIGAYMINVEEAVKNLQLQQMSKDEAKKQKRDAKKAAPAKAPRGKLTETITFLDTPGHAAFSAMRSRGAKVTDIVILVVSATEGVMPQTREALDHAKASGVPIIVAVNKMDLPEANFDRSMQGLSDLGLVPEAWGGDTMYVPVSGLTGMGMDKLLEAIQLQAEVLELKAPRDVAAEGSIVEAHLDKGRGPMATALIQKGTLKQGDFVVAGRCFGRVRALLDDTGAQLKEAGPATPVAVLGLDSVPEAGDQINVVANERAAKELIDLRAGKEKEEKDKQAGRMSLEDLYLKMSQGTVVELPLVVKTDVKGSAEAIQGALQKLPADKVRIKIVSSSVGGITESDVLLASASGAIILGFNVRPDSKSKNEAERREVEIKTYDVIYNLIDDVRRAMEGLLSPETKEVELGKAEIRNVFHLSKAGTIAGSFVIEGKIPRSAQVRLIRDGRVVYTGKLSGLKRFKDDAKEVAKGYECGISLENFMDIKVGDIVEAYKQENVAVTLESAQQPQA